MFAADSQAVVDANPLLHSCNARRNVILSGCLELVMGVTCHCSGQSRSALAAQSLFV
jgi:hypothetical protein